MAVEHMMPSRKVVYDELTHNPGKRYKRSGPEMRRLAAEHDLNPATLGTSLTDLASQGRIKTEREGREVLYFVEAANPGLGKAPKRQSSETRRYTVTYERDEDGYVVASVPALPGCHSQGASVEEAGRNIREAMRGYIASLEYRGDPVPEELASEQVEV